MYKVISKIVDKNRIKGYELQDRKTGKLLYVKREHIANLNNQVENCTITTNGLLVSKVLSMESLKSIPFKRCTTFKVNCKEGLSGVFCKGNQYKWRKGNLWLKADTQGYEGLAEVISSVFLSCVDLESLGVKYVKYAECKILTDIGKVYTGCFSKTMLNEDYETFITLHTLYMQTGKAFEVANDDKIQVEKRLKNTIDFIHSNYGIDITNYIIATLYVDALILNEDRHPSNLGLIYNEMNSSYRVAPIFDNGLSFLARQEEWKHVPMHVALRKIKLEPFGNKQIKAIQSLYKDFKLTIDINLLESRLNNLHLRHYDSILVERVKTMLLNNLKRQEGVLWVKK